MKKIYFSPETELIEIDVQAPILTVSGGGINDDNSAGMSDGPSDPGDFKW